MKQILTLLAVTGPLLGMAQTAPYQPMPNGTGASGLEQKLVDWKTANDTVAQYPGHSAIVRWERTQHPAQGTSPTMTRPMTAPHRDDHARPPKELAR